MHRSMFVPIITGSDKTTGWDWRPRISPCICVTQKHYKYCPAWTWERHCPCCLPSHPEEYIGIHFFIVEELIISKPANASENSNFQMFCRQMYHICLNLIFAPLKAHSTVPKIMKCPDGHFCHIIFGLGLYIADYPEQVWLTGIVSHWCPK
jgi:hypothetical protein